MKISAIKLIGVYIQVQRSLVRCEATVMRTLTFSSFATALQNLPQPTMYDEKVYY